MNEVDFISYLDFTNRVAKTMNNVNENELHIPVAVGKWTPFQLLNHITDSELVYFRRVKRTLVEDNPQLVGWQPTEWIELEDKFMKIEINLDLIKNIRLKLHSILKLATPNDWARKVTHPRYGELTLRTLIKQQIDHAEGHLNAINDSLNK